MGLPRSITRRQLAAAASAAGLAAAGSAQQPPSGDDSTPAALLAEAKQSVARSREALNRFKLDRAVEPASRFEV